jgi:hypothetical protein
MRSGGFSVPRQSAVRHKTGRRSLTATGHRTEVAREWAQGNPCLPVPLFLLRLLAHRKRDCERAEITSPAVMVAMGLASALRAARARKLRAPDNHVGGWGVPMLARHRPVFG